MFRKNFHKKLQKLVLKTKIYLAAILLGLIPLARAQSIIESVEVLDNYKAANELNSAQIRIGQMMKKLREQQARASSSSTRSAQGPGKLRLDQFSHALDVQLADKLESFNLFRVVEEKDLREALNSTNSGPADSSGSNRRKLAILNVTAVPTLSSWYGLPPRTNSDFDFKNTNVLNQLRNAGIKYLLLTTLEDLDENHIDGPSVTRSVEYLKGKSTGWWVEDMSRIYNGHSITREGVQSVSNWKLETVRVSPTMKQEQSLRVTLRSRLYDAQSGELLQSKTTFYARGRSYTAADVRNNEPSMGDLYQTAAVDLANWERTIIEDDLFPIKVLQIKDKQVLINRGSDSGIQINTHYNVWAKGETIKDPDSGEILGSVDDNVGEVYIRELQPKFSRALISEDNGIKVGSNLRLKP